MRGCSLFKRAVVAIIVTGTFLTGVGHAQRGIHLPNPPPPPIHVPPIQLQPPTMVTPPPPDIRIPEPQRPVACPCYQNGLYAGSSPGCCLR